MDEKKDKGRLRVVKLPKESKKKKSGFVSLMPKVSGRDRRQEVKEAMDRYSTASGNFITRAKEDIREGEGADDIVVCLAFELYIQEKMVSCFESIAKIIDNERFDEFIKLATSAAAYQRMVYTPEIARSNFEDFAVDLHNLCCKLEVTTLGWEATPIESAYMEKARKLAGV